LDEEGATTLILASRAGHYDLIGAILNCRLLVVGIDDQDDEGRTALYHACEQINVKIQLYNTKNTINSIYFFLIGEMGHVSVVKFLLVKKANFVLPSFGGKSPRDVAASPKIIRLLDLQAELLLRQQSHDGTKKTAVMGRK
jgi:ankyrin repeat protein